jgi:D-alanyl-D-alanine carboxypeptidase (penicillin-binding protein 5/6)
VLRRLTVVASVGVAILAATAGALAGPAPRVDASAVLVGNGATGLILHGERQGARQAIASITKIMTALVVMERATPNEIVRVAGPAPAIGEATIGLRAGERLTVRELLTAMLVESANDAAFALAYHVGDGSISRFVSLMNAKAQELGLADTRFARPDGLDAAGHYSSARDIFKLARVAMRKPLFRELVRIRRATVAGRPIVNRNDLLSSYPGTFGVKTGHTIGAGWSQVAAARRAGVTIYAVLLGGASREGRNGDLTRLLDWGFDQYRRVAIVSAGETYARAAVPFSDRRLALVAEESVVTLAQVGRPLVERVVAPAMVALPVEEGETLGELRVFEGRKLIAIRPLTAAESIEEPSLGQRLRWYAGRALDHAGDALSSLFGFIV